ncbi:glycosyltransferase family 2 protein [Stenotrophomonas sp. ATCM1_4]|uniref:glycosyltransferase family 2 protein n=1 Tax=Stenotrophomonas sp. ATCM1_4 TaxID=2259330 RepID=UPI001050BFA1|nr:glycosyltransferase family 2 protein [Stenotrophomonas sp. ATCM1_4]TDB27503.1 glycosyltransferase family 2 protein [Stenotrophomonas sp. ATCM1_4]
MNDPVPLSPNDVAVLIPALNEALRIREVVQGALALFPHVIVVDDGSDDDTTQRIADLPVIVLRHRQRRGKGDALRTGFREATRRGLRGVLTMDGDGQHAATDLPRLLACANRHPGCIIIGARLRKRAAQPLYRRLANAFGDWGIAWGTHYQVVDSQSGQRFYPAEVIALRDIPAEGFVFEAQLLISAARQLGTRCVSVPIDSRYRCAGSDEQFRPSHFRPLQDLYRITRHIVLFALRHGHVWRVYRTIRANPPLIDDADSRD